MSAFDGLRSYRLQRSENPDLDPPALIDLIRSIDPDAAALDFEAALELDVIVRPDAPFQQPHHFYRCCIADVILSVGASWSRTVLRGSDRLIKILARDEHQCFRSAQLIETEFDDETIEWWDVVMNRIRATEDLGKMRRARIAEKLSYHREIERLCLLGILKAPRWIALEDNTAGYDVLSYTQGDYGPVNRLIEVKSTIVSPLRFYLSRNEWEQALRNKDAYVFHVWDLSTTPARLFELGVDELAPNIPKDIGTGKWSNAEIPVT